MSYLSRLEESRRHLVTGDFLAAERQYWVARELWEGSRVRAPLERGVDPLLRLGARVFGRDPNKPVLATFPEREAQMLADLRDVAALLQRQAQEKARIDGENLAAEDVEVLARALLLRRESRIFQLAPSQIWPITRGYLDGAQRLGRGVDVEVLPERLQLEPEDAQWLIEWGGRRHRRQGEDARAISTWLLRQLDGFVQPDGALAGNAQALSLATRLALDDAAGAPRALEFGRRALRAPTPPDDALRLLRIVTSLACNEERLAVGFVDPAILQELSAVAAALGAAWPPPETAELLAARGQGELSDIAALSWSESERRLLVLRLHRRQPIDVLLLQLPEEAELVAQPFAVGLRAARQAVDRSLRPDAGVLLVAEPPAWVRAALGDRLQLRLDLLESALGPAPGAQAPQANRAHPVFDPEDPMAAAWRPLLQNAQWLLPRLLAYTQHPCFASGWGLDNLRALAAAGVEVAAAFARVVAASSERGDPPFVALQPVPGPLGLAWPRLALRAHRGAGESLAPIAAADVDRLLLRRPTPAELAASALAALPAQLYVDGPERADEVVALAAAQLDPTRITRLPSSDVCPEPALCVLERLSEESLVRPERGFDALRLYAALASAPEGDVTAELGRGSAAAQELASAIATIPERACRFEPWGDCFRHQLAERRRQSWICVEELTELGRAQPLENLFVDDPLPRCAGLDDAACLALLEQLRHAWAVSQRATLWLAAPRLGEALAKGLASVFASRVPVVEFVAPSNAVGMYCVPDGYRPDAALLADESQALLVARLKLWAQRRGTALWRREPEGAALAGLPLQSGISPAPAIPTVLVASLAEAAWNSETAWLRLAAALSWSQAELVLLDPRVHELRALLEQAPGLRAWRPERALLGDARNLLADSAAREALAWRKPITAERLRQVASWLDCELDSARAAELAESVGALTSPSRLLLCGTRDDERRLLAALIAELARESLDGGPLGIRTVVWVGEFDGPANWEERLDVRSVHVESAEDAASETTLLEIEAGRLQWVQLSPASLGSESVRRWARRGEALLWVWPQLEHWLDLHPARAGDAMRARAQDLLREAPRCLSFLDESAESAWAQTAAGAFGLAPMQSRSTQPNFQLLRRRLPDPQVGCPHCGEIRALEHARQPCPICGLARLDQPEPRVAAQRALAEVSARYLERAGPQEALLVVAKDEGEAERLRHCLGIEAADDEELFSGRISAYAQRVLSESQVLHARPAPARLVLSSLPNQSHRLQALLWRLHACGWQRIEVELLDHPVAWDLARGDDPEFGEFGPGASLHALHWQASRAEVEFRAQQQRQRVDGVDSHVDLWPRPQCGAPTRLELESVLAELEQAGISFEAAASPAIDLQLDRFDIEARRVVRWLVDERLLVHAANPEAANASQDAEFFEAMLGLPFDTLSPLPAMAAPLSAPERPTPAEASSSGAWILGVAGSGKSWRLLERADRLPSRRRRLLLLPSSGALVSATSREHAARPRLEVATVVELELAFLRQHDQAERHPRGLRLLPSAVSDEGRRMRHDLMREASRRYAVASGAVPQLDIEDLQLVLEDRSPRIAAKAEAGAAALDLSLLAECAQAARHAGGWITMGELRKWSQEALQRDEYLAAAWRHRYAAVLIDDAHAFASDELAFVEQLFPAELCSYAADPNLFEPQRNFGKQPIESNSRRLPREVAKAAASLLGGDPSRRTAPRTLRRSRGEFERQRVLNLAACALRIENDAKSGALDGGRNAVLVSHRGDLEPLAARLRESGLEIWPAEEVGRICAEGPRQLLAALQLVHGLATDMSSEQLADLAIVLLRAEGLYTQACDRHELARRMISWRHGVSVQVQRPAESLLLVLLQLERRLAGVWALAEAAQLLMDAGILARLMRSDAASERVRRFLDQDGERSWRELPSKLSLAALADPLCAGPHLWLLRPEDSAGLEFDRVYSICSGSEPVEHHYRALGVTREHFVLLFADRDPFAERP